MPSNMLSEFCRVRLYPTPSTMHVGMSVMERSDSRLLPVAALNERRRRAVTQRLCGMKLQQV